MILAASWSGGKDSCLACYKAMQQGHKVSYLANFVSKRYKRVSFHGTTAGLIAEQSRSIGIPLLQRETIGTDYEEQFKAAIGSLLEKGLEGMVFGDIYLQEHRDWVERVCSEIGVKALEPLWKMNTTDVYLEFVNLGFKAVVVSAKSDLIGREWLGHIIDKSFLEYLKRSGIDPCGENGEYHTFVTDGPIFNKQITVLKKDIVLRDGHWLMDIQDYIVENK